MDNEPRICYFTLVALKEKLIDILSTFMNTYFEVRGVCITGMLGPLSAHPEGKAVCCKGPAAHLENLGQLKCL